jgi:PAS domain S-box-containing protein
LLLSPARFTDDLIKLGLIKPGQSSALRIRIQDHSATLPAHASAQSVEQPLTRMAASATQGQQGTELTGYRDYRGVLVVGAWRWNTELGVGLAAEQDIAEAKNALHLMRNLVYGAGWIASVALLLVLYAFGVGRRQLRESQSRLGAVVNNAVDSIIVIDRRGQIESVNAATERMFGYTAEWLVGQNVRELMPEPYRAEHDGYLARYLATGEARVIGIGREVEARRADGSLFPIELTVSRLEMESGLHFAGVIRDVSQRKAAEADLEEERRFSQKALNALSSHIAVLDETGRIVFVNDAWRKFAQENGLQDEQACLGQNYLEVSQASRGLWSEEAPEVSRHLTAMLEEDKENFFLEYPCHGPGGQRWFLLLASRFSLRGKAMIVMSHENITARRLAEDKLRQEKEATEASNRILSLTQTAMARSGIGEFWVHAESGRFLRVSDRFCDDLGYSREELLGMSVLDVATERPAEDFGQLVSLIREQGWGRIESVYRSKDGRMIPVEVIIMYQTAGQDQDDMLIAFSMDIAARKEAEEALRRTSEELRMMSLVAAKTDNGVVLTDLDQRIQWVNPGFTVISGYSLDEVIGRKPGDFLQGEKTDPETVRRIGEAVHRQERVEVEIVNYHKNGAPYWVHMEITPVSNEAGEVVEFIALEQDVSGRREAEEALWISKERLEAAASAGIIGIWDWDVLNNRLVWDKVMYQLYGIREEDFGGGYDAWMNALHPDDRASIDAEIQAALRGERDYAPQFRVVWPDGSVHFIKSASHTTFDDQGRPLRMIGVNYDLTEQKKTEQVLAQASADAEAANRAKSAFLAMMSHEIRTPLNGIVGTIDMMGYGSLDPNQRNLVRTAKESSLALMTIIDDILDFSKIEAGRLDLERTPLSLENVMEGVAETLLPLASKKEVVLLIYSDPAIPGLLGDSVRLRQILLNLVSNAIKFSGGIPGRAGLVEVEATPYSLTPGQSVIRIRVRDNGIGMSPEVLTSLFRPFQQAETSTTRRFGGTGLGLVISRRLAELMGGDVAVQSLEGEGTVFTVTLAFEVAPPSVPKPRTDLSGLMVLLVMGDPHATMILESYIRHSGADLLAMDSAEVLNRFCEVHARNPDMVVAIECQGDEVASSRLCDRLREQAGDAPVRFLVISRGRRRQVRPLCGDAMTLDMNAMRRSVLINAVAALAGRESPELAPQELVLGVFSTAPTIEAAETAGQLILLAEDNETNQQVIRQQLSMLGYAAQVAGNGQQALTMWRQGRFALLLTDCHMPEMDGLRWSRFFEQVYKLKSAVQKGRGSWV